MPEDDRSLLSGICDVARRRSNKHLTQKFILKTSQAVVGADNLPLSDLLWSVSFGATR
jgi:hypothetical protein